MAKKYEDLLCQFSIQLREGVRPKVLFVTENYSIIIFLPVYVLRVQFSARLSQSVIANQKQQEETNN